MFCAAGFYAVEGVFGDGPAPAVRGQVARRRGYERRVRFRDFRKTGYKIFKRYKESGFEALSDRCRRPVRYANQLPPQIESVIVRCKREKPHWGARKIRELLVRRLTRTCASRPRVRSTPFCTVTAWSKVSVGGVFVQPGPSFPLALRPTNYGAPTSKASSSSATVATSVCT